MVAKNGSSVQPGQLVQSTRQVEVEGILKPWHHEPDKPKKIGLKAGSSGIVQDDGCIAFECGTGHTITVKPDAIPHDAYAAV